MSPKMVIQNEEKLYAVMVRLRVMNSARIDKKINVKIKEAEQIMILYVILIPVNANKNQLLDVIMGLL